MSYSKRYRERTIEYRQAGHSLEATHQVFKVSKSTIQKWKSSWKKRGIGKRKICIEVSERSIQKNWRHMLRPTQTHTNQKWLRHLDAAKAAFETHCGGIRSQGKKDDQLSGAGSAKGSGISGRDQRYTAGKDRLCGWKRYRYILVSGIWVCAAGSASVRTSSWTKVSALWHCRCSDRWQNSCAVSV